MLDDPGAGLLDALEECIEPSRLHEDIVVEEGDVLGADLSHSGAASLVRGEIALGPDELEPTRPGLPLQVEPQRRRRVALHIDQLGRVAG